MHPLDFTANHDAVILSDSEFPDVVTHSICYPDTVSDIHEQNVLPSPWGRRKESSYRGTDGPSAPVTRCSVYLHHNSLESLYLGGHVFDAVSSLSLTVHVTSILICIGEEILQ